MKKYLNPHILISAIAAVVVVLLIITYSFLFVDWTDDVDLKTTRYGIGKCNNPQEVKRLAIIDFEKKQAKWFVPGFRKLVLEKKITANHYLEIEKKRHVKVIYFGCVGNYKYDCYNNIIDSLNNTVGYQ